MTVKTDLVQVQTSFKNLLRLFEEEAILENLELGDTWHPFSGFVDESIFSPRPMVKELLKHDYDFKGLVHFSTTIGSVKIVLSKAVNGIRQEKPTASKYTFELSGPVKTMVQLKHLVIELNAYSPGKYKIS